jgi:nucleoside-diphosphate-sugar epimerase
MNTLIIGGTNFIGPAVAKRLFIEGHNVTLFHRSAVNNPDEYTHIQGDCESVDDLQNAINTAKPDVIIHMVAYFQSHIAALEKALNGCSVKTVIISSMDVYKGYEVFTRLSDAPPVSVPFTEQSALRDVLYPYRGKLDLDIAHDYEKILVERAALESSALNAVILRLGMVYGENDHNRRFADPIGKMKSGAKSVELSKGASEFRASKCYVDNVAHGIVLTAAQGQPHEVYNLADEWILTEREWCELLAKKLNRSGDIVVSDKENPDMNTRQHLVADTAKIRALLGYREPVSLDRALSNTIEWELSKSENK